MMLLVALLIIVFQTFDQSRGVMYNRVGGRGGGGRGGGGGQGNSCGQQAAGRRCYGTTYNFKARLFCCNGVPYPCNAPAGWSCCGRRLVHSSRNLCCNNIPLPREPNMVCCNQKRMDITESVCCEKGRIQPRLGPFTHCCHENAYDSRRQLCCNRKVILKEDARFHPACAPANRQRAQEPWHFF